jgi:cell division protein FtsX
MSTKSDRKNIAHAIEIILETKSRNAIALKQSLRHFESWYPDNYTKSLMLKLLPLLSHSDRKWMKELF